MRPERQSDERWLAAVIPSYGGHYFDADGSIHVYLANLADSQPAKYLLAPIAEERRRRVSSSDRTMPTIEYHHGAYTYLELTSWLDTARHHVFAAEGVRGMGIDARRNAVAIGVENERAGADVIDSLTRLGVPRGAIQVRFGGGLSIRR
jgi:hypothetical protein